jgi:predicted GNAT superfamily acetyltransferase
MEDTINGGDASDRLEAVWALDRDLPSRASGAPDPTCGAPPALIVDTDGWPRAIHAEPFAGAVMAVPADYETLRQRDPARSRAWRTASREVLEAAYAAGLRVGRVTAAGYVLVAEDDAE